MVIEGLSKGVAPDTTAKALETMKSKGIQILKEVDLQKINGKLYWKNVSLLRK